MWRLLFGSPDTLFGLAPDQSLTIARTAAQPGHSSWLEMDEKKTQNDQKSNNQ
jgi:hypothetical protein